jgi:small-conductance mechanosensitive channel
MMAMLIVSLLVVLPLLSDGSEGAPVTDVAVALSPGSEGELKLYSGESGGVILHFVNKNVSTVRFVELNSTVLDPRLSYSIYNEEHVLLSPEFIELDPGDDRWLLIQITADSYSGSAGHLQAKFSFDIYDPSDPLGTMAVYDLDVIVNITSGRASENQFNNILGIFTNPFPPPFDVAVYAAAATFLIWLAVSFLISFLLFPKLVMPLIIRDSKKYRNTATKRIQRPLFFILMVYGITLSVAVMGASEFVIRGVETIALIIYILFGALIAWRLFTAILDKLDRRKADKRGDDEPDDSLRPLTEMVAKIAMGMVIVGTIMGVLGLDIMIIATGAGIVGLGISLGAQSTLAQFFSGFTLLINRPFRPGDLVRLDSGTDTLRVINVGFMMTTFKNWANSEIFTMPNQKVVNSTIVNVTAESLTYRIAVLVNVPYDNDVALAKKLALEAMIEHPRILQDGSEETPKARFEEFSDSSLMIRVSGFVDDFEDHRSIAGEIREAIYAKYRENGITIAIPKMDVYVRDHGKGEKKY